MPAGSLARPASRFESTVAAAGRKALPVGTVERDHHVEQLVSSDIDRRDGANDSGIIQTKARARTRHESAIPAAMEPTAKQNGDVLRAGVEGQQIQMAVAIQIARGHRDGRSPNVQALRRREAPGATIERNDNIVSRAPHSNQIQTFVFIDVDDNGIRQTFHTQMPWRGEGGVAEPCDEGNATTRVHANQIGDAVLVQVGDSQCGGQSHEVDVRRGLEGAVGFAEKQSQPAQLKVRKYCIRQAIHVQIANRENATHASWS